MKKDFTFPLYIHIGIYIISSIIFAYYIDISMIDDGLRHISFSVNYETMKNWGEIYPSSLFSTYDPWMNWHNLLKALLIVVPYDKLHILVNFLTLLPLMILLHKYLKLYVKYDFGSLSYVIVFIIVYLSTYRYLMVRPDQLSGLFVFTALLLPNRFIWSFLLTILYGPFYYLFFLYTGSLGLVYMIQKKWSAFGGIFIASIIVLVYHLIQDFQGYTTTVINILTDQRLRVGLEVTEGQPLFNVLTNINYFLLLGVFFLFSAFIIYKKYSFFKENTLALFLILTSILWVNQYRYFQLFLPFITIFILSLAIKVNIKKISYFLRKYIVMSKRLLDYSKNKPSFYLIIIPLMIFLFSYELSLKYKPLSKKLTKDKFFESSEFNNKTILLNNMSSAIYTSLYYNPTIKIIPSCSIGWFEDTNKNMKDIYIRMQKQNGISEEELWKLINFTHADIYIHYLKNEKQELNFKKLEQYGIIPYKIFQNFIIFNILKKDQINE